MTDINHPRNLLIMWRSEAEDLQRHIEEHNKKSETQTLAAIILQSSVNTLRRCADQLESRLQWSNLE